MVSNEDNKPSFNAQFCLCWKRRGRKYSKVLLFTNYGLHVTLSSKSGVLEGSLGTVFCCGQYFAVVACNKCNVANITCNKCDVAYITCNECNVCNVCNKCKKIWCGMTVQLSENYLFEKGGTESLPDVFLHDNCELICFLPGGTVGFPAQPGSTWRNHRLPSPTRINLKEP